MKYNLEDTKTELKVIKKELTHHWNYINQLTQKQHMLEQRMVMLAEEDEEQ